MSTSSSSNPLGYTGIDFYSQPVIIEAKRAPTINDVQIPGTRWRDASVTPAVIYETVDAGVWNTASAGALNNLGSDAGTASPSGGVINIVGGVGITTSAAGNVVTITNTGGAGGLTSVPTDSGAAAPLAGVLNLLGNSAQGVASSGSGNTVTYTVGDTSTTTKGVVLLATNAEAIAGADTTKAVTSDDLKAKLGAQTLHGFLIGNSQTGAVNATAAPTDGQLPIGRTGMDPIPATLTAGSGVSIINAAGSITISASATSMTWNNNATSTTMTTNNGYIITAGAQSFALPAVSAVGDTLELMLNGGTSWTITQAASQQVRVNANTSTLGAAGTTATTANGDTIKLICTTANLIWQSTSTQGNLTVL